MFVAIGKSLTKPVLSIGGSTTIRHYKVFIEHLARFIRSDHHKPVLVYDGAPAHVSEKSLPYVRRYFRPLQQTGYSSFFNPAESVFSMMRRNFLKLMLMQTETITEAKFLQMVQ